MPVVMVRVDDRLLHGQVSLGWQPTLAATLIVVADDRAADDAWEREVYEASGPDGVDVAVSSIADAAAAWAGWERARSRVLVIVRDASSVHRLREAGVDVGARINVGGLHAGDGRTERNYGYFLSDADIDRIGRLEVAGVTCQFQALPSDVVRTLSDVVGSGDEGS